MSEVREEEKRYEEAEVRLGLREKERGEREEERVRTSQRQPSIKRLPKAKGRESVCQSRHPCENRPMTPPPTNGDVKHEFPDAGNSGGNGSGSAMDGAAEKSGRPNREAAMTALAPRSLRGSPTRPIPKVKSKLGANLTKNYGLLRAEAFSKMKGFIT